VHGPFLRPALHPTGMNFSNKGIIFPLMNPDVLNEILGRNIVTTRNPWGFNTTVSIFLWMQWSGFRIQVCFLPVLSTFDLEHIRRKTSFRPLDELPPIIV
jgi:hypothetical protein